MKNLKIFQLFGLLVVMFYPVLSNAQTQEYHYPKLNQKESGYLSWYLKSYILINDTKPTGSSVFEDRMEIYFKRQDKIILFSDLPCNSIKVLSSRNRYELIIKDYIFTIDPNTNTTSINGIEDWRAYVINQAAEELFLIQIQINAKRYSAQIAAFEPIAAQYHELPVKPTISEEQRKYIVQANSFNNLKNYEKTIELYNKVIEYDQTSYPAAYSNMALVFAQMNLFDAAIYNMKKYLLLEPAASDSRNAQDKIYEWEAQLGK